MELKVLPILGPSKVMTAMTTMATRARMIAYSTRPWPFSFGANNMLIFLSKNVLSEARPQNCPKYIHFRMKIQAQNEQIVYKIVSLSIVKTGSCTLPAVHWRVLDESDPCFGANTVVIFPS